MYRIQWDFIDENGLVHQNNSIDFEDKDAANEVWTSLKHNPNVTNIGTSVEEDKYIVLTVKFQNYGKTYDYLSKQTAEIGTFAVVRTSDGLTVVSVVGCSKLSRTQLESKLPFAKYKHIVGLVK